MSDIDTLADMGFDREKAQLALKSGGNLQGAIDYLDKHADTPLEELKETAAAASSSQVPDPSAEARSLKCNECQKQLRTHAQAEFHATKTGHTDFSESSEKLAPLSAEERDAKLAEARERLAAKRAQTSEEDKAATKRNEQIKRKATKEQADAKEELQRKERMKEAKEAKAEKTAGIEAKKRVQEKIKADREERAHKAAVEKAQREGQAVPVQEEKPVVAARPAAAKPASEFTEARLRLQTEGGTVQKNFGAETTLFEVAHAVNEEKGVDVSSFVSNYPKKTWDRSDFGMTLREAGMVPSAALVVK